MIPILKKVFLKSLSALTITACFAKGDCVLEENDNSSTSSKIIQQKIVQTKTISTFSEQNLDVNIGAMKDYKSPKAPDLTRLSFEELSNNSSLLKRKNILSLDGGGIRGIMQLYFLVELEEVTKKSINELFDSFSGTSIGGIIACALTIPNDLEPLKPKYTAKQIFEYMISIKGEMFKKNICSFCGLFSSKYKGDSFKKSLKDFFGDNLFHRRTKPTIIISHDKSLNKIKVFSSDNMKEQFYTYDVCAATAAAPTYFPAQIINPINNSHIRYRLIDGGVSANNAGPLSFLDFYNADDKHYYVVVSLGTGETAEIMTPINGGIIKWSSKIVDVFMGGQSSANHLLMQKFAKLMQKLKIGEYHRWNPVIPKDQLALDNISNQNVQALITAARRQIDHDQKKQLNDIIKALTEIPQTEKNLMDLH